MGLLSEYDLYRIPYSLLETEQLEHFFEEKALEGHLIKKLSCGRENGSFLSVSPGKYHFSIGFYDREVTEREEKSERFLEFCRRWEENGWEYNASLKNLATFYSKGEEKPPVPGRFYLSGCSSEPYKVTARAENRALFSMTWIYLLLVILYIFLVLQGPQRYRSRAAESLWNLALGLIPFWFWDVFIISVKIRQRIALRYLKETGRIPKFRFFWDEAAFNTAGSLVLAIFVLICGVLELAEKTSFFSLSAILSAATILLFLYLEYRRKKDRYLWLRRGISIVPFILLAISLYNYPFERDYRFQTKDAEWNYESLSEKESVFSQGMDPEELGWGEVVHNFYVNSSNLVCESERIIYRNVLGEGHGDMRTGEYVRKLRYVGTLKVELKKETYLKPYLQQKKLSLDGSMLLDTGGRMKYYLTQTGKEIIGTRGKEVVVYFLNNYDEQTFDPEDGRLREEIKRLEQ